MWVRQLLPNPVLLSSGPSLVGDELFVCSPWGRDDASLDTGRTLQPRLHPLPLSALAPSAMLCTAQEGVLRVWVSAPARDGNSQQEVELCHRAPDYVEPALGCGHGPQELAHIS